MSDVDVFQAIAHPARRQLLDALRAGELPVRTLADRFASSRPAVSQHLRLLLDAGLVAERRSGRENLYRLTPDALIEVVSWVNSYEEFWGARLRDLRDVLDTEQ